MKKEKFNKFLELPFPSFPGDIDVADFALVDSNFAGNVYQYLGNGSNVMDMKDIHKMKAMVDEYQYRDSQEEEDILYIKKYLSIMEEINELISE